MKGILWLTLEGQQLPYPLLSTEFVEANHFHVTLQFGVEPTEAQLALVGSKVVVQVVGLAYNELIQAAVVRLPEGWETTNKVAHMTLGHLPEVKPFQSNQMLDSEHNWVELNETLELSFEFLEWK
jgi:2'-5' RNA ligase